MRRRLLAVIALAGCGRVGFDPAASIGTDASSDGIAPDGPPPCAAFSPWSPPLRLDELASTGEEWSPALHPGGDVLVFESDRNGDSDLFVAMRTGPTSFSAPVRVAISTNVNDAAPSWTSDGTELYFTSNRAGSDQVWVSTYDNAILGLPRLVPEITGGALGPEIAPDGLELLYTTTNAPFDLRRAVRPTSSSPWQPVGSQGLEQINTNATEGWASFGSSALLIYFETTRRGIVEIYTATRSDRSQPFTSPMPIDELNMTGNESSDADLSFDDRTMLFSSDRFGNGTRYDLYLSTRTCL